MISFGRHFSGFSACVEAHSSCSTVVTKTCLYHDAALHLLQAQYFVSHAVRALNSVAQTSTLYYREYELLGNTKLIHTLLLSQETSCHDPTKVVKFTENVAWRKSNAWEMWRLFVIVSALFLPYQVIIYMALANGKWRIRCGKLSLHTETAIHFVQEITSHVASQIRNSDTMKENVPCVCDCVCVLCFVSVSGDHLHGIGERQINNTMR